MTLDFVQPAHASGTNVASTPGYSLVRTGLPVYPRIAADFNNNSIYPGRSEYHVTSETRQGYPGSSGYPVNAGNRFGYQGGSEYLGNAGSLGYPGNSEYLGNTGNRFGYPGGSEYLGNAGSLGYPWGPAEHPVNDENNSGYPWSSEYPGHAATPPGIRSQSAYNPVKAGRPVNSGFAAGVFAGFPVSSGTGARRDNGAVDPYHWRSVGDEVRQAQPSPSCVSSGYCVSDELFERQGSKSVDLQGESEASQREFRMSVLHKLAGMERCMVQLMRAVDALILTQRQ